MFFIHARGAGNYVAGKFLALCHTRHAGPKLNLVAPAVISGAGSELTGADRGFDHCTAISFLGQIWLAAGEAHAIDFVRISRVPHTGCEQRGDLVNLAPDWMDRCSFAQIFPPTTCVTSGALPQQHIDQHYATSLKAAVDKGPLRRKNAKKKTGRVVMVDPGDVDSSAGTEPGSESGGGAGAGSDDDVSDPEDLPPMEQFLAAALAEEEEEAGD